MAHRLLFQLLFPVWLVLAIPATQASPPLHSPHSNQSMSEALLFHTGVDDLLVQYPELVKSGVLQRIRSAGAPDHVAQPYYPLIEGAFAADSTRVELAERLAQALTTGELQAILDWYASPLGQKIQAAELAAMTAGEYQSLQSHLETLPERYRGSERERQFAAFDRATQATRTMVDNTTSVQIAMAATLLQMAGKPGSPDFSDLRQALEQRRGTLRGRVGQQVYLNYLATYEALSDEELADYIRFARSEPGARFFEALNGALYDMLVARSEALINRPWVASQG